MSSANHSPDERSTALNLYLISDFNLETLGRYVSNDSGGPQVIATAAPFGQVFPSLLHPHPDTSDFALVWTSPEMVVPAFGDALNGVEFDEDRLLAELGEFADCLHHAQRHFRGIFVVSWTLPAYRRGNNLLGLRRRGTRRLLLKMNLALAEKLENYPSIYLFDGQRWMDKNSYSPKLWYLTKTPFHPEVFFHAASDLKAAISAILGASRKLLVVDLDNLLWGGEVGEVGWEDLRLGGHDYVGEALLDFQEALKSLRNRGILLAIASKNDEAIAMEALTKHPQMVLRPDDFAAIRINWSDKAANVVELAEQLNLSLQSVVFIDDSPIERARVREALPEVYVPEWPDDKTLFASTLLQMGCFDTAYATDEDASRQQMYATERHRQLSKQMVGSAEEWLLSCHTIVEIEEYCDANRERIAQLLNKTNQMNLASRRISLQEIQVWLQQENRKLWAFRVSDRFGDSGLSGALSLEIESEIAWITDFVLSCRVMGRNIENVMVAFAAQHCAALRLRELRADYIPTANNKPCFRFWMSSGFSYNEERNRFVWFLREPYQFPHGIEVRLQSFPIRI